MIRNGVQMAAIAAAYIGLFMLLPYYLYGMPARPGKWFAKVFFTLCASTAQMALLVYALAFLHLLSFWPLLLSSMAIYAAIYLLSRRISPATVMTRVYNFIIRVHAGYYRPRVMLAQARHRILHGIYRWYRAYIRTQPLWALGIAACFAYGIAIRALPVILRSPYGVTDLYVYTQWIKAMLDGNIFLSGVYFYGMHNIIASMSLLLQVNVVTILRVLGATYAFVTMLAVFWVFRTVFENKWAVFVALAAYGCILTFTENTYFRHSYTLAQEFSQMFWVVSCGFFVTYLEQETRFDLYGFTLSLLCIVLAHYYGLIVAALFCIAYFLVYIKKIFANRARMFRHLVAAVATAFVLGLLPLLAGLLLGKPLEGSFYWGLMVMESGAEATVAVPDGTSYFQRVLEGFDQMALPLSYYLERFIPLVLSFAVAFILLAIRRTRQAGVRLLGLCLAMGFLFIAMIAAPLGLPLLLDQWRAPMFFTMLSGALYATPVELLELLTQRARRAVSVVAAAACVALLWFHYGLKPVAWGPARAQTEGAVRAYYQILSEYPTGTWTVVSPVDDFSLIQREGYHYELYDFILEMEPYDPSMETVIPTNTIFFYVEKIPLNYELIGNPDAQAAYPLNIEDANGTLIPAEHEEWVTSNSAYGLYHNRRILQAKAYAWVRAYQHYFPDDMSVYYEDDELIVYRFTQNMYTLSNLAIDYGYNAGTSGGEVARP